MSRSRRIWREACRQRDAARVARLLARRVISELDRRLPWYVIQSALLGAHEATSALNDRMRIAALRPLRRYLRDEIERNAAAINRAFGRSP